MSTFVIAISGGSGAPYALRLLEVLLSGEQEVKAVVSPAGEKILDIECGVRLRGSIIDKQTTLRKALRIDSSEVGLELYDHKNLAAPISSGSFACDGMVIVPCSGGTMGRIANGISSDLISRAADVALKERRRLIVVPRETPVSEIHLRNMLAVTRAGAIVLPAMPGFYHKPRTISDMVDMIVSRILDHLAVENHIFERWKGEGVSKFLSIDDE
ncbi:MAG: UbiX family flavin prenyltransferase [Candidatus Krumholzibacteria bacterium]|nr:UbiX family flavin prenyltransferase [Candidatus Krumholzibacteria bacterium]